MLEIDIPGRAPLCLEHLVLDMNGTLALDGTLLPGMAGRLARLRPDLKPWLLSADTHGSLASVASFLDIEAVRLVHGVPEDEQKAAFVRSLGAGSVVAVGNGRNDVRMLEEAALGLGVVGPEGMAAALVSAADIIVTAPEHALELLLHPQRIVATLRH